MKKIVLSLVLISSLSAFTSTSSKDLFKYQSIGGGGFYFGGYHMRNATPQIKNLKIVDIIPPVANAGCGGIDIQLGGLSFVSFSALKDNFQSLMSNAGGAALGYAFQLALSTLCKECSTLLNDLQNLANAINSLNFDACSVISGFGDELASKVLNTNIKDGKYADYNNAKQESSGGWLDSTASFLGGKINSITNAVKDYKDAFGNLFNPVETVGVGSYIYTILNADKFHSGKLTKLLNDTQNINDVDIQIFTTLLFGDFLTYFIEEEEKVKQQYTKIDSAMTIDNAIATIFTGRGDDNSLEKINNISIYKNPSKIKEQRDITLSSLVIGNYDWTFDNIIGNPEKDKRNVSQYIQNQLRELLRYTADSNISNSEVDKQDNRLWNKMLAASPQNLYYTINDLAKNIISFSRDSKNKTDSAMVSKLTSERSNPQLDKIVRILGQSIAINLSSGFLQSYLETVKTKMHLVKIKKTDIKVDSNQDRDKELERFIEKMNERIEELEKIIKTKQAEAARAYNEANKEIQEYIKQQTKSTLENSSDKKGSK